ncbi:MAG: PspA/IM30 family protein [Pseudomonadota bacterium]
MALINRVTQLFKADVHAVLDRIEEPEQTLRQAIREMQSELGEMERRVAAAKEEVEEYASRKADLERRTAEIDRELDFCFAKDKMDLARGLVRRKLEATRLAKRLAARGESAAKYVSKTMAEIESQRTALEGVQQKASVFARQPVTDREFDDIAFLANELAVGEDELDVAFLKEQEKRTQP